ncbi:MAG: glycosyltransferase [Pseudomonadota bacterium]
MASILLIVNVAVSGPATTGGNQRTALLFQALKAAHDVDVMIVGAGVAPLHREAFSGAGKVIDAIHAPPSAAPAVQWARGLMPPRFGDKVASALLPRRNAYSPDAAIARSLASFSAEPYDLIVGRHLKPIARAGGFDWRPCAPVIIDIDDRDDLFFLSRLGRKRFNPLLDAFNLWHGRQARRIMDEKLPQADHLWIIAEEDRNAFDHRSISLLPNIPYALPETAPAPQAEAKRLVFLGPPIYAPNRDGVFRFVQKCWPSIKRAEPTAELCIGGRGWERAAPAWLRQTQGVEIKGFVEDLTDFYARAAIAIAPVYDGAGTKIKVAEALAYARPVVAAAHSARGFAADMLADCIDSATTDRDMATACIELLKEPTRAAQRGASGRAYVASRYSRRRFEQIVLEDCARVLQRSAAEQN